MSAQRPMYALIAGLTLSSALAAAMVFAVRNLAPRYAMVAEALIPALLVMVFAGCVIVMVFGGRGAPRRDDGRQLNNPSGTHAT